MGPLFDTSFSGKVKKAARGEGGPESYLKKSIKKSMFFMVFRVRSFLEIQGARSRGLEPFWPELTKPSRRVLEDPPGPCSTRDIWRFAGTFPSKG